ncbi:MAG: MscL family protein [Candidatus Saccharimonadales bacterium]
MADKATSKQPSAAQSAREAREDARKARAEAVKARAEAARAKAAAVGVNQVGGFVNFIREKGVVGLAVGLALGTAATVVVTQIVNAVITPTVSLIIGENGLKGLNFVARRAADGSPLVVYAVGDLIDAIIKFLAVAAVIYFVVMGLKLDKLDKKKED